MNVLLIANQCLTDSTAGVSHSLRQIIRWLREAGHDCRALMTSRFETNVAFSVQEHLLDRGHALHQGPDPVGARSLSIKGGAGRPVYRFHMHGVDTHLLHTQHQDESKPDAAESLQYESLFDSLVRAARPDLLIAFNGHPMIRSCMIRARQQGMVVAYALRGYKYEQSDILKHADHVFTCSAFLTRHYEQLVGLTSTPLEPPLDWATTLAPEDERAFVTFINPSLHKGVLVFARLAAMLGQRRPDIPVLVIQSGQSAYPLTRIPDIDFTKYPQIMAAPATSTPGEIFALTRLLLVPSVWPEPFGRVAAEAMVNGVPVLVSDRGALPDVIAGDVLEGGAGRVLPLPDYLTPQCNELPHPHEIEPWFEAVCAFWDDEDLYARAARQGRQLAADRYSEDLLRRRHLDYFEGMAAAQ